MSVINTDPALDHSYTPKHVRSIGAAKRSACHRVVVKSGHWHNVSVYHNYALLSHGEGPLLAVNLESLD